MTLWRISEHPNLSGEGGRIGTARWHTRGRPVVYLTESPASAMLERVVHFLDDEDGNLPRFYQLLQISAPDGAAVKPLSTMMPIDWRERSVFTRQLGDAWLASLETPLARVPSAIAPYTWNLLLNPEHPDARLVQIESVTLERFDNRLFRFGAH